MAAIMISSVGHLAGADSPKSSSAVTCLLRSWMLGVPKSWAALHA